MKIRNLLFILLFLSANLEAQFVFVPDSNFRKFIKLQIGSTAIVGDSLDTTNTNLLSLHLLSVNDWALAGGHISDIESIQYFKNVDSLFLTCLLITNLNKFPPKISFLNYSYSSSHKEINNIPSSVRILELIYDSIINYGHLPDSLKILSIYSCFSPILPVLPQSMEQLIIYRTPIDSIHGLPNSLQFLQISETHIQRLDSLPKNLIELDLNNNNLTNIPPLPAGLKKLQCGKNNIDSLPELNTKLIYLNCYLNNLHFLPILNDSLRTLSCSANPLILLPSLKSPLETLSCSVSCLPHLPNSLKFLYYYGCIPNHPPLLNGYFPLCNVEAEYFPIPDTAIGICNDSLIAPLLFKSYHWNTGDTTNFLYGVCKGVYSCILTDSLNCETNIYINNIQTNLSLSATDVYEVSCDGGGSFIDLLVTGGRPPYSYLWEPGEPDTYIYSCITCQDIFSFNLNHWWPDCGLVKCTVTDADGNTDSIFHDICPNYYPDDQYQLTNYPLCPGIPTGVIGIWSSVNAPLGPNVNILETDLDTGYYVLTKGYGQGCTAEWDYDMQPLFNECKQAYTLIVYAPSCGQCDGYFYLINNCPSNIAYINLSFHNLVDSLGQGYYLDDLCPDRWYYISIKVSADFCQDYFIQDSFYVSHAAYCSTVYPGDANNDGITNNIDLLSIGIAYSDTGFARVDTTITWDAKYAMDWQNVFTDSTNHKHADSNGNGIINYDDTIAIIQNYGLQHQKPLMPQFITGAPALFIPLPDTILPNTLYTIPISLGDIVTQVDSIYGLAFSVAMDENLIYIDSLTISFDSTWLGNSNSNLLSIAKKTNAGRFEASVTRTDHINVNGYGTIGNLSFKTKPIPIDTLFTITTGNIFAVLNDGTNEIINAWSDTSMFLNTVSSVIENSFDAHNFIQIIPNPNSGSFIIQLPEWHKEYSTIEIFNALGEKVYSTEMPNGLNRKEITIKQSAGIYTCKLTTDDRFSQRKFVVY